MLKTNIARGVLLAILALAVSPAAARAETIGMVDTMRVLNEYQAVGAAEKQFKSQVEKFKREYEDRLRKLQEARKKNLSKPQLEKLERQFTKEMEPLKAQIDSLNRQLTSRLKKQLDEAVAKVAQQKKIAVVFDKQAILHGGFDLTDDVLQQLNSGR